MKRINDVPRTAAGADPKEMPAGKASCASAVELAGVLLAHTMEEAEAPISQLSEALARVAQSINGGPAGGVRGAAPGSPADMQAITRDLAVCIEKLQFHDRLMQQLTRVRDILAALAADRRLVDIPAQAPGGKSGPGSIELF
ncbi:MAG TPA: hypothetical protein VFO44_10295 [Steroidobacteraceae bacterium]|nr:hypothetical protein [Steroidobacteraceae bacterium]